MGRIRMDTPTSTHATPRAGGMAARLALSARRGRLAGMTIEASAVETGTTDQGRFSARSPLAALVVTATVQARGPSTVEELRAAMAAMRARRTAAWRAGELGKPPSWRPDLPSAARRKPW